MNNPWSPFLNPDDKETNLSAAVRTVSVSLQIVTSDPADEVLRSVMAAVFETGLPVISNHAYEPGDLGGPEVQLVVCDGHLLAAYVDRPERAVEHAADAGGVVVRLGADGDYRARAEVAT